MSLVTDPDDNYLSSDDSDFAPDEEVARDATPEDPDDEDVVDAGAPKRKRQAGEDEAEDAGFENSGDEAIIQKGKNKRRKKVRDQGPVQDGEQGEQGSLIKTRSQRALEKSERKAYTASGPVTIDVNLLWAEMNRPSTATRPEAKVTPASGVATGTTENPEIAPGAPQTASVTKPLSDRDPARMVKIRRMYNFAGKVHTEEKLVSWDSAEAKLYLETATEDADPDASEQPKRRPKRAFRSIFEPVSEQMLQRSDLNLCIAARMRARETAASEPQKLTTLQKSRVDWAGYVDKEGIKDELQLAGKSKDSYAVREGFLARSEARREEDAKRARMAA